MRTAGVRSRVRDHATIDAELDASALRGGQRVLGALFILVHHRHDPHRQPVGFMDCRVRWRPERIEDQQHFKVPQLFVATGATKWNDEL